MAGRPSRSLTSESFGRIQAVPSRDSFYTFHDRVQPLARAWRNPLLLCGESGLRGSSSRLRAHRREIWSGRMGCREERATGSPSGWPSHTPAAQLRDAVPRVLSRMDSFPLRGPLPFGRSTTHPCAEPLCMATGPVATASLRGEAVATVFPLMRARCPRSGVARSTPRSARCSSARWCRSLRPPRLLPRGCQSGASGGSRPRSA